MIMAMSVWGLFSPDSYEMRVCPTLSTLLVLLGPVVLKHIGRIRISFAVGMMTFSLQVLAAYYLSHPLRHALS